MAHLLGMRRLGCRLASRASSRPSGWFGLPCRPRRHPMLDAAVWRMYVCPAYGTYS